MQMYEATTHPLPPFSRGFPHYCQIFEHHVHLRPVTLAPPRVSMLASPQIAACPGASNKSCPGLPAYVDLRSEISDTADT
jgi:hypothetical protein